MSPSYAIKSSAEYLEQEGTVVTFRERPYWDSSQIGVGDQVFLWRSTGPNGSLESDLGWVAEVTARSKMLEKRNSASPFVFSLRQTPFLIGGSLPTRITDLETGL